MVDDNRFRIRIWSCLVRCPEIQEDVQKQRSVNPTGTKVWNWEVQIRKIKQACRCCDPFQEVHEDCFTWMPTCFTNCSAHLCPWQNKSCCSSEFLKGHFKTRNKQRTAHQDWNIWLSVSKYMVGLSWFEVRLRAENCFAQVQVWCEWLLHPLLRGPRHCTPRPRFSGWVW